MPVEGTMLPGWRGLRNGIRAPNCILGYLYFQTLASSPPDSRARGRSANRVGWRPDSYLDWRSGLGHIVTQISSGEAEVGRNGMTEKVWEATA